MKGQTDFAGEAIDEMMKVMNNAGRKATTFCFAGYSKEMAEFETYNAGIASRIKYRFHFDDYTVDELVQITNLKLKKFGYAATPSIAFFLSFPCPSTPFHFSSDPFHLAFHAALRLPSVPCPSTTAGTSRASTTPASIS